MAEHRSLPVIGVGQHLIQEREIARFLNVRKDSVEQPKAIIRAVLVFFRFGFTARTMSKWLDYWHRAARRNLSRNHQFEALPRLLRDRGYDAEQILNRVAVSEAITFP